MISTLAHQVLVLKREVRGEWGVGGLPGDSLRRVKEDYRRV